MEALSSIVSRVANQTYGHSRNFMPPQPWWQNLEPSFHKFPDDFYLDFRTQTLVESAAVVDIGLRTLMAGYAAACCLPTTLWPPQLMRDAKDRYFYQQLADRQDPGLFYRKPEKDVTIRKGKPGPLDFKPDDGGTCELLSFESPFEAVNPKLRAAYASHRKNRIAWAEHWRHPGEPRPTICVIHGFMADPYWVNSRFLALPWFYKQGYDVLLMTLPFHGRRQSTGSPFSGYGYFAHGILHVNECMAHAVHDFRLFLDYLFRLGVPKAGVTGISLGGYTTGVLAAVEDRLSFALPNVPVVSLVDLLYEWFPVSPILKAGLRIGGINIHEARHTMAVSCPLTYKPLLPKEKLMIISGAGDRLAPPKHTRLLWEHWGRCRLHWFPGNHIIHLDQGKYLKDMAQFLRDTGFDR